MRKWRSDDETGKVGISVVDISPTRREPPRQWIATSVMLVTVGLLLVGLWLLVG